MRMKVGSRHLTELDALRGIAAFIVFMGHFCEGLVPVVTASINGTILFVALNGPAAVIVFFVLSGFVLTLRPLQTGRVGLLMMLTLKRWPRLAGPVAVAGLGYSLAAVLGFYPRAEVASTMALPPHVPAYLFWGQAQHNERLGEVMHEALIGTFLHEAAQHNGVLWTMHWEFLGSFLAISLAVVMLLKLPVVIRAAIFVALWSTATFYSPWLIAFPVGVIVAIVHNLIGRRICVGNIYAIMMLLCGAVIMSWDIRTQVGIWAWTGRLAFQPRFFLWITGQAIAAVLWMTVALYNPTIRRWLSSPLGAFSGRLSFSFYLVHLLVLCSLSAWLYILVSPTGPGVWSGIMLFLVSAIATLGLAVPLMMFDRCWISILEYLTTAISLPRRVALHSARVRNRHY